MSNQSFHLFQLFCRALSHRFRTPLSVLANEVSYIETLMPLGGELDKCKEKLKIVLELLRFGGFTRDLNDIIASYSVGTAVTGVVNDFGRGIPVFIKSQECSIDLNLSHLSFALTSMLSLLLGCQEVKLEISGPEILLSGKSSFSGPSNSFDLFSDFATILEADYFLAPLVDGVILANQWIFSARFVDQQFLIVLKL